MKRAIIIAAGGYSRRFGQNKMELLLDGKPLWRHVWENATSVVGVDATIVAIPPTARDYFFTYTDVHFCAGSDTRARSVYAALCTFPQEVEWIGVMDAARPFQTSELIQSCFQHAEEHQCGCIACAPVTDTIKNVRNHIVQSTLDRSELFAAQTPQVFEYSKLRMAYKKAFDCGLDPTDDAAAYAFSGHTVRTYIHTLPNLKVTYPIDYLIAQALYTEMKK